MKKIPWPLQSKTSWLVSRPMTNNSHFSKLRKVARRFQGDYFSTVVREKLLRWNGFGVAIFLESIAVVGLRSTRTVRGRWPGKSRSIGRAGRSFWFSCRRGHFREHIPFRIAAFITSQQIVKSGIPISMQNRKYVANNQLNLIQYFELNE